MESNGLRVQVMHNGLRILAGGYHGKPMQKIIRIQKGHHEPQEEKVFYEILKHIPEEAVMLEIGSFWAYYSMWFSYKKPLRQNFLIEPVEWKSLIGQLNFALNEKYVDVDRYFIKDPEQSLEKSTGMQPQQIKAPEEIEIDDYIKMKNIKKIDILHADIQGAEVSMLKGANKALSEHKIDYLFISTHDDRHQRCLKILEDKNYVILAQHSPEQSFSADGLIVAAGKYAPSKQHFQV